MSRDLFAYFSDVASHYADVEHAYHPLARHLVDLVGVAADERVLDIGTGSGLAAREAAECGAVVAACDFSAPMIREAVTHHTPHPFIADIHQLPLPAHAFDVVLAALAFNSTDPHRAAAEAYRVLRPGGRLALMEWGSRDKLSELFRHTLADYKLEDPPPDLAAYREALQTPMPWDELETMDDIVAVLEACGFSVEVAQVDTPESPLTVRQFIRYKLAWPNRRREVEALSEEMQHLFLSDIEENLSAKADSAGLLIWRPYMVCIRARR